MSGAQPAVASVAAANEASRHWPGSDGLSQTILPSLNLDAAARDSGWAATQAGLHQGVTPDHAAHLSASAAASALPGSTAAAAAATAARSSQASHQVDMTGPFRVQIAGHERREAELRQQLRHAGEEARDREGVVLILRSQLEAERGAAAATLAAAAAAAATAAAGPRPEVGLAGGMCYLLHTSKYCLVQAIPSVFWFLTVMRAVRLDLGCNGHS